MCSNDFFLAIKESEYVNTIQYDEIDLELIGKSAHKLAASFTLTVFDEKDEIEVSEFRKKI